MKKERVEADAAGSRDRSLRVSAVVAAYTDHWISGDQDPDRPYKTVCACGHAAYVYSTHLAEVAVDALMERGIAEFKVTVEES